MEFYFFDIDFFGICCNDEPDACPYFAFWGKPETEPGIPKSLELLFPVCSLMQREKVEVA